MLIISCVRGTLGGPFTLATNTAASIRHRLPDFFQAGFLLRMGAGVTSAGLPVS
jgi:hypothetical protein